MSTEHPPSSAATAAAPRLGSVNALQVLREVLSLEEESNPDIDVEDTIRDAIANPEAEVIDSFGAVSVLCILYSAYTPERFIPDDLLTHQNLTTLAGVARIVARLNQRGLP